MKKIIKIITLILTFFMLAGCVLSQEVKGTYYVTGEGGSAMLFRSDDNPAREILLHYEDDFANDEILYEAFDISKNFDDLQNCMAFHGTATIILSKMNKIEENFYQASVTDVIERTEPVCEPL